jgi:hypothetical protein
MGCIRISKIPDEMHIGFPFTTLHLPPTPQNTKAHGLPIGQDEEIPWEGTGLLVYLKRNEKEGSGLICTFRPIYKSNRCYACFNSVT